MYSILTYTLNLMPHEADLGDGAHSFGSSLSEDKPLVYVQVLWGFNEAEVYGSFVSCAQAVSGHRQDSCCLPDATAVHCGRGETSTTKTVRGKSHILAFKSVQVQASHPWLDILARWSSGDAKLVSRPQTPSMPVGLILVTP